MNRRRLLRNALYLASIGLALHLVLPQLAGLQESARLLVRSSHLLVGAAFIAQVLSQVCYAEVMGRLAATVPREGRRQRQLGRWFLFRLTITENGASHVLPGGATAKAAVTFSALRSLGFESGRLGVALAALSAIIYGTLGAVFFLSLVYLTLTRNLSGPVLAAAISTAAVTLAGFALSYLAYRNPRSSRRVLAAAIRLIGRVLRRRWSPEEAAGRADRIVEYLRGEFRAVRTKFWGRPRRALRFGALALGYWAFDALCLVLMFLAFGVPAGTTELLVSYGVATTVASLPLTPGGIGVFETTMLATVTLLGVGPDAVVPILGYRIFNFWLSIPVAAIFYPTLRLRTRR